MRALAPVVVAVALSAWALTACQGSEPSTRTTPSEPSGVPSAPPSVAEPYGGIWPARTTDEAMSLQEGADAGAAAWLLDPARVAAGYARSVRRWGFPEVRAAGEGAYEVEDPGSGEVIAISLDQPVRPGEGGIWVVTRAHRVSRGELPRAIARTRNAILEAALAGDYEPLRPLLPPDFVCTFGGGEDPIVHWQEREADWGEKPLETMAGILSMPFGVIQTEPGTYHVWPAVYGREPFLLTDEERDMLATVYPDIDSAVESWTEFGGYIGWRIGIREDGTWAFFVAGD